jgi:2-dehydro-3-deoxygluconokinase
MFLSIGECMVELSELTAGTLAKSFAGDSFNTAYYARQALPKDWRVEYLTSVGDDNLSDEMIGFMQARHIGTKFITKRRGEYPGLYMIHLHQGERSFSYWRSQSAARHLAADPALLKQAIDQADVLFFSGITLAIVDEGERANLFAALDHARERGCQIVFDPNIRQRLWSSMEQARALLTQAAAYATILLPSFDDEVLCFGDLDTARTIARYRALGIEHIVVKNGAAGVRLYYKGRDEFVAARRVENIVDTTSAGDSFNGSYIARLMCGDDPVLAAHYAAQVAAFVIGHRGAIIAHNI